LILLGYFLLHLLNKAAGLSELLCDFRRSSATGSRLQLSLWDRISDATSRRVRGPPEQRLGRSAAPETDGASS